MTKSEGKRNRHFFGCLYYFLGEMFRYNLIDRNQHTIVHHNIH